MKNYYHFLTNRSSLIFKPVFLGVALLALWFVGCVPSNKAEDGGDAVSLIGTRWLLLSFTDKHGSIPTPTDPIPYLEINDDSLRFDNGCNHVSANYQVDEEQFTIELALLRGIDCTDRVSPEAVALETAVHSSLSTWSTYEIDGDELLIHFDGGEVRFQRDTSSGTPTASP